MVRGNNDSSPMVYLICLTSTPILRYICLFWTCMWNIQERWSLYVHILCGLLSCVSNPVCKKYWWCLHTPLHVCWWFGTPLDYELSLLRNVLFLPIWVYYQIKDSCLTSYSFVDYMPLYVYWCLHMYSVIIRNKIHTFSWSWSDKCVPLLKLVKQMCTPSVNHHPTNYYIIVDS